MDLSLKPFPKTDRDIFIYNIIDEETSQNLSKSINNIIISDDNVIRNNKYVINYLYKDAKINFEKYIPDINIFMETFGGSVYSGLNMYDTIKNLTNHCNVNITVKGKCMSMGIPILLSVPYEHRFATSSTTFMIHQVSSAAIGKCADMEDEVKECKRLTNVLFEIIKNNTLITQEDLDNNYDKKSDWILTAEEALKKKLISKIV